MKFKPFLILLFLVDSFPIIHVHAAVDGTTGTPLGGLGTGAVKFNAGYGTFTFNDQTPTRYGDYQLLAGAQFQLYTKSAGSIITSYPLKATQMSGRIDDNAVFPTHQVNFGILNGTGINLNAFGPFDPIVSDNMAFPGAFYDFTFTNTGDSESEISIAFQMTTEQNPIIISGKGFSDETGLHQKCVFVYDEQGSAVVSVGSDSAFFQTGNCENSISGKTNRAAAFFKLPVGGVKTVTFIFAWYNNSDKTRYYYTNFYGKATEVANAGLIHLPVYKQAAFSFVNRMRASNLPSWIIDQTLNSLVNIVNNSIYTADGRYCHNEGMYQMDGTMDQMWHSRQINVQLIPEIAWKELEYWARCQKKAVASEGQIHHDFGSNATYTIASWDESEYQDYRDIDAWVDLNCGFIISVYETYIATADSIKLAYLWPYVKNAGQRILNQVVLEGDKTYPYTFSTSSSSYDNGGESQAFNSGLSIVTYKVLHSLAEEMGETVLASTYTAACDTAIKYFSQRWLDQPFITGKACESILGGPWIANFLKLDQDWASSKLNILFSTITNFYSPLGSGLGYAGGSYEEWQTYLVGHLGGYALQTGRVDIWRALQYDMYERNTLDRNRVFNEPLGIPSKVMSPVYIASNSSSADQYISIPVLWRNYYDLIGFHRNKATGELWLEPNLPAELNHNLLNACIISPEGYATISTSESGDSWQNQRITFTSDKSIQVNAIYAKDKYSDTIRSVRVNGADKQYIRVGTGYQRQLKIIWSGSIDSSGIILEVVGDPIMLKTPAAPDQLRATSVSPSRIDLVWRNNAVDATGYRIECKIGGVFTTIGTVGAHDTTFSHTTLLQNTQYFYHVVAYNNDGNSGFSNVASAITKSAGTGDVVIAINSGGPLYLGKEGTQYITDVNASFCAGGTAYSTTATVSGTPDGSLYQTERYGIFSYALSMQNGYYEVTLKFAEIYQTGAGLRLFNVTIEDSTVISNMDIFALAGENSAYDVTIPVTLADGILNIAFISVKDNAKLSALVVRKASPTGVKNRIEQSQKCFAYSLFQNHPNPFNPSTSISFTLPSRSFVTLKIFDLLGREVSTIVSEELPAGDHSRQWNAEDFPSGVYFYRLQAGSFIETKKLVLLK